MAESTMEILRDPQMLRNLSVNVNDLEYSREFRRDKNANYLHQLIQSTK